MTTLLYDEIVDFIARANPQQVSGFHASEKTRERVAELIALEKNEGLAPTDAAELETYMQMEHVMRLAKARARLLLAE